MFDEIRESQADIEEHHQLGYGSSVLIIAPGSELQVLAELITASGGNQPTILHGIVSHREVLATIRRQHFDIMHFAGHGDSMELELSDGPLAVEMLASAIGENRTELIILNACRSLPAAVTLHARGISYVIGWRDDVHDVAAENFAVSFFNTLRLNGDVHQSFDTASQIMQRSYEDEEPPMLLNGQFSKMQGKIDSLQNQLLHTSDSDVLYWRIGTVIAGLIGLTGVVLALMH